MIQTWKATFVSFWIEPRRASNTSTCFSFLDKRMYTQLFLRKNGIAAFLSPSYKANLPEETKSTRATTVSDIISYFKVCRRKSSATVRWKRKLCMQIWTDKDVWESRDQAPDIQSCDQHPRGTTHYPPPKLLAPVLCFVPNLWMLFPRSPRF